jgi:choline monooxygenase
MAFFVDKDIRKATTLPSSFYKSQVIFNQLLEQLFVPSWQFIGHADLLPSPAYAYPFMLLEDSLDEPLVLVRDKENELRCLSNVCTHRGMFLIDQPGKYRLLSCKYHGRAFNLDGQFRSMPEFKEAENFPSEMDHLPKLPLEKLGNFLFTALEPTLDFKTVFQPILDRMAWFPFQDLVYRPEESRTYTIKTHWALYCDNYLEGFHVPFVHPSLNDALDYKEYDTEIFDYCNLQLGVASEGTPSFQLPEDSVDYGKNILAYYWWVFPNLMLNIYTWGISVNIVEPIDLHTTRVVFKTYLFDDERSNDFNQQDLHDTEMEDEEVVERVHKGLQSRLYKHGRFSPTKEKGVHHFHSLLSQLIQ